MSTLFSREAMLDILVNIVPLGIIAFFVALFLVFAPWGYELIPMAIMIGLHVVPFALLVLITYLSSVLSRVGESVADQSASAAHRFGPSSSSIASCSSSTDSRPALIPMTRS